MHRLSADRNIQLADSRIQTLSSSVWLSSVAINHSDFYFPITRSDEFSTLKSFRAWKMFVLRFSLQRSTIYRRQKNGSCKGNICTIKPRSNAFIYTRINCQNRGICHGIVSLITELLFQIQSRNYNRKSECAIYQPRASILSISSIEYRDLWESDSLIGKS